MPLPQIILDAKVKVTRSNGTCPKETSVFESQTQYMYMLNANGFISKYKVINR